MRTNQSVQHNVMANMRLQSGDPRINGSIGSQGSQGQQMQVGDSSMFTAEKSPPNLGSKNIQQKLMSAQNLELRTLSNKDT
jgi:hypothetical protein